MRTTSGLTAIILAGAALPSYAADNIPTLDVTPFMAGQAPKATLNAALAKATSTSIEKPASLNGTLYAVVAPTYYSGGTISYIRLFTAAGTTFSVTLVGNNSGITYGTANIVVGANESLQYSLGPAGGSPNLQTLAGAAAPSGADTSYAVYIQAAADSTAGYAHVTYNDANKFFEDSSVCANLLSPTLVTLDNAEVLINVHTSLLSNWPSQITLSNFWNAAVTYRLTVRDSTTGLAVGTGSMLLTAQPNATYVIPESQIESTLGFTPTSGQPHLNVFVVDTSGAVPNAVIGHSIVNSQYNAQFNLTTACAVNAVSSSLGGTGGSGLSGY